MESKPPPTSNIPNEIPLLTPEEFRVLVARLQRNIDGIQLFGWAVIVVSTMMILGCIVLSFWSDEANFTKTICACGFISALTMCLIAYSVQKDKNQVKHLLNFVAHTQDVRQLGPILDLRYMAGKRDGIWREAKIAANDAVDRLLLVLHPDDVDVLNTRQRAYLRYRLFRQNYVYYSSNHSRESYHSACLLALSAFEQIGDNRDLPDVERLLEITYLTDQIRAATERCVQTIRERVAREQDKDVLLRADRKPEAVETLLRPSVERDDTPPQQLLRAATSDDGNTPA